MNTDPNQTAQQLRLAATILETGHPVEWQQRDGTWYKCSSAGATNFLSQGFKIRLALATPPDGRPLHNPDNLDAEKVGAGYRLVCYDDSTHADKLEQWMGREWVAVHTIGPSSFRHCQSTYRLPLSVPWPEQLPPPPPGMRWHREEGWRDGDLPPGYRPMYRGERVEDGDQVWHAFAGWYDSGNEGEGQSNGLKYRTRRPLTFEHAGKTWTYHRPGDPMPCEYSRTIEIYLLDGQTAKGNSSSFGCWVDVGQASIIGWRYAEPETKEVELGPEDMKPFTVIRRKGEAQTWHWRTVSYVDAVKVTCGNRGYGWAELASDYERNESLTLTGKWNPDAWEPCKKTITIEKP